MNHLLSLFLLLAPAGAMNLRGGAAPGRRLVVGNITDDDVNCFTVEYKMGGLTRTATQADLEDFQSVTQSWMAPNIIAADPESSVEECVSEMASSGFSNSLSQVNVNMRYCCEFEDLIAPAIDPWTESVDRVSQSNIGNLTFDAGLFHEATSTVVTGFVAVGSSERSEFEDSYVLPYGLTWKFTTPPTLAGQQDFDAVHNATEDWITLFWDVNYGFESKFARQNIRADTRTTSFSPRDNIYQQSVSLGVEILVGANNITHVPSVQDYARRMQLYYPVSNFTEILSGYLAANSILRRSSQTTFAVTPTFNVATLSDFTSRGEGKVEAGELEDSVVAVAVVVNPSDVGGGE